MSFLGCTPKLRTALGHTAVPRRQLFHASERSHAVAACGVYAQPE